jgi:hypothetical protein
MYNETHSNRNYPQRNRKLNNNQEYLGITATDEVIKRASKKEDPTDGLNILVLELEKGTKTLLTLAGFQEWITEMWGRARIWSHAKRDLEAIDSEQAEQIFRETKKDHWNQHTETDINEIAIEGLYAQKLKLLIEETEPHHSDTRTLQKLCKGKMTKNKMQWVLKGKSAEFEKELKVRSEMKKLGISRKSLECKIAHSAGILNEIKASNTSVEEIVADFLNELDEKIKNNVKSATKITKILGENDSPPFEWVKLAEMMEIRKMDMTREDWATMQMAKTKEENANEE